MIFKAGKTAFRPNGAQHVSLGQVNPRMRINAAPGSQQYSMDIALKGQSILCDALIGNAVKDFSQ